MAGAATPSPRRPRLSGSYTSEIKRTQIMEACVRMVCKKGVWRLKVTDLNRESKRSKRTFYELFDGKEDCLEQTLAWIGGRVLLQMDDGAGEGGTEGCLAALLDFVAEHPHQARFFLLNGPSVSLSALLAAENSFGHLLDDAGVKGPAREMVVGGVASVLRSQLYSDPKADPRPLLDGLTAFVETAAPDARQAGA